MRPYYLPTVILLCLWLVQIAIFPVFFASPLAPNLFLCALLVFAVTDFDLRYFWLSIGAAIILDVQNRLVIGSFALSVPLLYILAASASKQFLRGDRMYVVVPALYMVGRFIIHIWVYFVGYFASILGWDTPPLFSFRQELAWVWGTLAGAVLTVIFYFIWLELLHRTDKPLRLRV